MKLADKIKNNVAQYNNTPEAKARRGYDGDERIRIIYEALSALLIEESKKGSDSVLILVDSRSSNEHTFVLSDRTKSKIRNAVKELGYENPKSLDLNIDTATTIALDDLAKRDGLRFYRSSTMSNNYTETWYSISFGVYDDRIDIGYTGHLLPEHKK